MVTYLVVFSHELQLRSEVDSSQENLQVFKTLSHVHAGAMSILDPYADDIAEVLEAELISLITYQGASDGLQAVERCARRIASELFDSHAVGMDKAISMMHREDLKYVVPTDICMD